MEDRYVHTETTQSSKTKKQVRKTNAVCTLFEKTYHYGVAALVNSLCRHGFRGEFYAGYRGALPGWAEDARPNELLNWPGAQTMKIKDDVQLHLLPLTTDNHLTNYKPDFMLQLWDGPAADVSQMFYMDPDVVVDAHWGFFEEWSSYGVAVCEDVNSPLAANHPRRRGWRRYFRECGIELRFREAAYANGGFIGVTINNRRFLEIWKAIQEHMAREIGGLSNSQFGHINGSTLKLNDPHYMFSKTDQDALNAALEAWNGEVSFVGREAMGFANGACLLPHAIGPAKPWNSSPLWMAIQGYPPRFIDHGYLKNVGGHIAIHSKWFRLKRKFELRIAGFIGRFYKRS